MNPKNIEAVIYAEQMQWKIGFVSLAMLFIVGCAPVKKVTTETVKSDVKASTELSKNLDNTVSLDVKKTNETAVVKSLEEIEKLTEDFENRLTTYDTSKPIDAITGKPPVASERIITNKKQAQKQVNATESTKSTHKSDSMSISTLKLKLDSMQQVNAHLISATETRTTQVNNWWKWYLAGIVTAVVIFIVVKNNWHAKVFVWLLNLFRFRK